MYIKIYESVYLNIWGSYQIEQETKGDIQVLSTNAMLEDFMWCGKYRDIGSISGAIIEEVEKTL